jgi:hypothetical protein
MSSPGQTEQREGRPGNHPKNLSSLLPVIRRRVTGKREHLQFVPASISGKFLLVSGAEVRVEKCKYQKLASFKI